MASATAPDLRTAFPRGGREELGGYVWLARLIDKARAERAGTHGEYSAYCPISLGFLERAGYSRDAFATLIERDVSDEDIVRLFDQNVAPEHKASANRFILETMAKHLDEQDAEEGRDTRLSEP